jgi:hypothetical protein
MEGGYRRDLHSFLASKDRGKSRSSGIRNFWKVIGRPGQASRAFFQFYLSPNPDIIRLDELHHSPPFRSSLSSQPVFKIVFNALTGTGTRPPVEWIPSTAMAI